MEAGRLTTVFSHRNDFGKLVPEEGPNYSVKKLISDHNPMT